MVLRCCGLKKVPSARTVGRWLSGFDPRALEGLRQLNEALTCAVIGEAELKRLTIDVDGSVVCTGLQVQGARRGYNPHHRKVPSYYPITAYEAQTGQVLSVANRPGNVHNGKAGVDFIDKLIARMRRALDERSILEFRMDGALFRHDVLEILKQAPAVEYAIKVPFAPWLGLKERIAKRRRWQGVGEGIGYFEQTVPTAPWDKTLRVVIYRKRVWHRSAKNFQLDLFDPDDGYHEYSALATNKRVSGRTLWYFMCARGTHEKVYGELKGRFAFGCVPTRRYVANSAWQLLSVLAFNLTRGFQRDTVASPRSSNRKRRSLWRFCSIHTLHYQLLHRAGLLARPGGSQVLDVGTAPAVKKYFGAIEEALQAA